MNRTYLAFLTIIVLWLLFRLLIIHSLPITNQLSEPLFITDMVGGGMRLSWQIVLLFGFLNLLLFYYVGKSFYNNKVGLLAVLIVAFSPWFSYLEISGSIYIFMLFWIYLFLIGGRISKKGKIITGFTISLLSSLVLVYSSLIGLFLIPTLFFGMKLYLKKFFYLKKFVLLFIIFCFPLFYFSVKNYIGLKNVFNNQITILQVPELRNTPNSFYGESGKEGYYFLARISENKYVYFIKHLILKSFKNLTPSTFFTPQEKLLGFSFSPPIFFGFLIPFIYGFYLVNKLKDIKNYLFLSIFFILPSLLSKPLVELNHLILFSPVVIYLISYGFIKLLENREKKYFNTVIFISLFLVITQATVTIFDITNREFYRYQNLNSKQIFTKSE